MSCCEGKTNCASPDTRTDDAVKEAVKDYYGKRIKKTDDLLTSACVSTAKPAEHVRKALALIHEEVLSTYYGCGLVYPEVVQGMRILDLGSGSGRDCFVLSKLVGEKGSIVGVDMTDEQLALANKHIEFHTKAFGYTVPNVIFKKGYIERLGELGLPENSFDIIVSNCVINLSPDKRAVLEGAFRLLKPGGELYFSDVYSDRRVPTRLTKDPVLWGECLTGALYWNDFLHLASGVGFTDPRLVSSKKLLLSGKVADVLNPIKFYSAEYRLFKIANLEKDCEDYGQAVRYRGTADSSKEFRLDAHHTFATGKVYPVCGNTYLMLKESRLASHFEFFGDMTTHFGIFPGCGKQNTLEAAAGSEAAPIASGCC